MAQEMKPIKGSRDIKCFSIHLKTFHNLIFSNSKMGIIKIHGINYYINETIKLHYHIDKLKKEPQKYLNYQLEEHKKYLRLLNKELKHYKDQYELQESKEHNLFDYKISNNILIKDKDVEYLLNQLNLASEKSGMIILTDYKAIYNINKNYITSCRMMEKTLINAKNILTFHIKHNNNIEINKFEELEKIMQTIIDEYSIIIFKSEEETISIEKSYNALLPNNQIIFSLY